MVDLHSHSTASDGERSPGELVSYAKESGVSVLALTDHDTVSGLDEAGEACKKEGIVFVPGIELNVGWPTGEFHLLGLGLKSISKKLSSIIKRVQQERIERNKKIIQRFVDAGYGVRYEELLAFAADAEKKTVDKVNVGRPHIAGYLVQKKIVKKRQQAFDKFLAKGLPFYIPRTGADLDEAVDAIYECGGVPVIAHPLSLYVSWGRIEDILAGIHERGVSGLEAWHSGARETDCIRLEKLARKLGFFVTAGSDYHGPDVRADRKIGRTAGGRKIEDKFYFEELLPHLNQTL